MGFKKVALVEGLLAIPLSFFRVPVWFVVYSSVHCCSSMNVVVPSLCMCELAAVCNKLSGKPRNMPPPLYAARCSPAPAHTRLTPAAPSTPCVMNIHDRQAAARSGFDYGVHINSM